MEKIDFLFFEDFGSIVWDEMIKICILWFDVISSARLDIHSNFNRSGRNKFSKTEKYVQNCENVFRKMTLPKTEKFYNFDQ